MLLGSLIFDMVTPLDTGKFLNRMGAFDSSTEWSRGTKEPHSS
jgi:hypothetical protein